MPKHKHFAFSVKSILSIYKSQVHATMLPNYNYFYSLLRYDSNSGFAKPEKKSKSFHSALSGLAICLLLMCLSVQGFAQTTLAWRGSVSNDWFTAANWTIGGVTSTIIPDATTNVTIPGTSSIVNWPTITSGTARCRQFTAANASNFYMSGGVLEVSANWSKALVCNVSITGGRVVFVGTGTQSIAGENTFWDLEIKNTATGAGNVNINNALVIENDLFLTTGRFQPGGGTASNTIYLRGNMYFNGGNFKPNFGTFVFDGAQDKVIGGTGAAPFTFYKVVLNKTSGAQALTATKDVTIGEDFEIQNGEYVVGPTAGVELEITQDLTILNGGAIHLNNTAGSGNVEIRIGRNLTDYNNTAPSRSVVSNTAKGFNFTDRFALVTFNGTSPTANQIVRGFAPVAALVATNSLTEGILLPAVTVNTNSTVFLDNNGARVLGNMNITKGTFQLNGKTLIFGTGLSTPNSGTLTVATGGTLFCDANSSFLLTTVNLSGPLVTTSGSGVIRFIGTSNSAMAQINRDGNSGCYFRIRIASGGTLHARFYSITLINPEGLILQSGAILAAAPNNLSDGIFNETGGTSIIRYIVLNNNITGGTTISNVTFNLSAGTVYNVTRPSGLTGVVTMQNCAGIRSTEVYEDDPADGAKRATHGLIRWSILGNTHTWTGAIDNRWYLAGNWSTNLVPSSIDDVIIPTPTSARYPVLEANVLINNISISANTPADGTSVFNTNGKNLTISGSLTKTNTRGTFFLTAGSTLTIGSNITFPAAARFNAAVGSTVVLGGNTSPNQPFVFDEVELYGGLFLNNNANNLTINNIRLTSGNITYVNSSINLNIRGNWLNIGGEFTPVGGRVSFIGATSGTQTITSRSVPFATVLFDPTANVTYKIIDTLIARSTGSGGATDGASIRLVGATNQVVVLDINGKLLAANNIEVVASSGVNTAHLLASPGSQIQINSGYSLSASGSGVPQISLLGDEANRVVVSRQGTGSYSFNLSTSTVNLGAVYADFEYMDGNGINVTAAVIDAQNNFSNCLFSNFLGIAGTLLRLPNQSLPSIFNTRFFFNGTPVRGTHFNVFRSGAGNGEAVFVEFTGNLGGANFERDATTTVNPGNIIWQASLTTVYWGPFASGNWNDSPSKWRDVTGNVVPVPNNTQNVVLDHTHYAGEYTVTLDGATVVARTVRMNSDLTHQITLIHPVGTIFNLSGGFEMASPLDRFVSEARMNVRGSWLTAVGSYVPGTNAIVHMLTNNLSVACGTNSFNNLTINASGRIITLVDQLNVTQAFVLQNGTLFVGSANNRIVLHGNITMSGGDFSAGTGTVELAGPNNQTISNAAGLQFYNLTLNKSAGVVTLAHNITINNNLNFTGPNKARINTGSLTVKMGPSAQATGVNAIGSNGYVNGRMSFVFNNAISQFSKTFPIGKFPDYMPMELSLQLATATNTEFVAEVFNAAPTARTLPSGGQVVGYSSVHHYAINKIGTTDVAAASVTLSYKASDLTSMGIAGNVVDVATIRILKSNSTNNAIWDDITTGSLGAVGDLTGGKITSTSAWTTFSDFVVAAGPQPFPVELLSFEGSYNAETQAIDLNWLTSSEQNNAGFVVTRATELHSTFLALDSYQTNATLVGQGNSQLPMPYSYVDAKDLMAGQTYFYQLAQVDYSGKANKSQTIAVTVPGTGTKFLGQYPNPASSVSYFQFYLEAASDVKLQVFSMDGKLVTETADSFSAGNHKMEWQPNGLTDGIYLYNISGNDFSQGGKLVLQGGN